MQVELEREEFLTVPPLFKYGPSLLLLAGLLVTALAVAAGLWRIHEGLKSGYAQAFANTAATAEAAKENVEQWLSRLGQVRQYIDSIQRSPAQKDQLTGMLHGLGSQAVAISSDGQALSAAVRSKSAAALALRSAAHPLARLLPPGGQVMLPAIRLEEAGMLLVPVVQRPSVAGPVDRVVVLLDEQALSGVVRKAFAHEGGWLLIRDAAGHDVLDLLVPSRRAGVEGKPRDKLTSPAQAMKGPLDFDSQRLLVATTAARHAGEPRVSVGMTEAAALADGKKRIIATWVIVAFVLPVLGSLGVTALALRRFSTVEEYLRRLARNDALTGLPNRRRFVSLLRAAVERSQREHRRLALLYIDIDDFKYVNDSLGHAAGDTLLKHVGSVLTEIVRDKDHVCRLGGDEFTIIAPDVSDAEAALQLGNRILERLALGVRIAGTDLRPKASIGIALMPSCAQSEEDLTRFADTAMYRAKTDGKNRCVVYEQSMTAQELAKAQTIQDLERAIPAGQLFLVYQPKFELSSGRLTGHEALVRWNHPSRGVLPPGEFIPLAEESGLIVELGNWVLEESLRQIQEWERQGHGRHRVAINVSALQLQDDSFSDRVAQALLRYAVPGSSLQLEITESSLAADAAKVKKMVRDLRRRGVLVAVDDFGTGYSSLAALQQYDLDMLKVDRSFVSVVHTPQGEALCRAIVTLGHALGMSVVGEGVETAEQAAALHALKCDQVQGYYFSRPLPAEVACRIHSTSRWTPVRTVTDVLVPPTAAQARHRARHPEYVDSVR